MMMPDLVAAASSRFDFSDRQDRIGDRVRITRGPLQGFSGLVAELTGDEVLVDLRSMVTGLFIRCRKQHVVLVNESA